MTDHKNEATRTLGLADEASVRSADGAKVLTATAQVHATLYLAEQQRIANLIAMFKLNPEDAQDFITQGVVYSQIGLEIREGLGI